MEDRKTSGPDPLFPFLNEHQRYRFPLPDNHPGSIIAVGGNLSPGMLLSAYEQGIFPWYNPGDPILWQSPDPRFLIFPEKLHVSASMRKILRRGEFKFALDRDFAGVIRSCAGMYRPGQGGTWITGDIMDAYGELHRLGWAHSAESYQDGELVGGCYGIRLGETFCGESMFAKRSNASKAAFLSLARVLFEDGLLFIDCQVPTDHLRSLGGEEMSRRDFLKLLRGILSVRPYAVNRRDALDRRGNWGERYQLPRW
ncbi:MAG: leucyl/phenylalanyl-tRNA--protein transferase [Spirochaetaceae bacterium]|jgi:leucyl/phenylalanyl-tRNA--protein transferase|nr:leucyl/phenylalanyl-tRNA--protein transferase [Spirochaetaceae bacterium]